MRIAAAFTLATLLAACSGSTRVERIAPGWANSPRQGAPRYEARKQAESPASVPAAPPQTARPNPPGPGEE
jgi:hypothetical protein